MARKYKDLVRGDVRYTEGYPEMLYDENNNHIIDIRGWGRLAVENNHDHAKANVEQTVIADGICHRLNNYEAVAQLSKELLGCYMREAWNAGFEHHESIQEGDWGGDFEDFLKSFFEEHKTKMIIDGTEE